MRAVFLVLFFALVAVVICEQQTEAKKVPSKDENKKPSLKSDVHLVKEPKDTDEDEDDEIVNFLEEEIAHKIANDIAHDAEMETKEDPMERFHPRNVKDVNKDEDDNMDDDEANEDEIDSKTDDDIEKDGELDPIEDSQDPRHHHSHHSRHRSGVRRSHWGRGRRFGGRRYGRRWHRRPRWGKRFRSRMKRFGKRMKRWGKKLRAGMGRIVRKIRWKQVGGFLERFVVPIATAAIGKKDGIDDVNEDLLEAVN